MPQVMLAMEADWEPIVNSYANVESTGQADSADIEEDDEEFEEFDEEDFDEDFDDDFEEEEDDYIEPEEDEDFDD